MELETRLELPADHRYFGGIDTSMTIDDSMHSLFGVSKAAADLMVQEYGRYFDMPTVCFRAGCLTGPNHAGAKLHGFLSYLMRCTVTGEPYTVFGYDGQQVRDNIHSADLVRAFEAFHRAPRPAAVYNIGGGRYSNCSMLEAIALCEEIAGRTPRVDARRPGAHGRPPLVDQRPARVPGATIPDWEPRVRPARRSCARSTTRTSSAGAPRREALGGDPRPRRGGLDRGHGARRWSPRSSGAAIDHEIIVVDDDSTRRHGADRGAIAGVASSARVRRILSPYRGGFGLTVRAGLERFAGDAVAIVMADGSDDPQRPRPLPPAARGGLRLRLRLALHAGLGGHDYPQLKLAINRVVNLGIRVLFRHGYNDTTNAFKAYRREVIDNIQPLLSNHFNLTVELPLKAVIRGHSFAIVPISWTNRDAGRVEARAAGDGQPLPVHRALRVPRGPPQPRRLPAPAAGDASVEPARLSLSCRVSMTSMIRVLAILAVVAVWLAAVPAAEAAKRRVPRAFHGVMWDGPVVNGSARQLDSQWALMARSGVESVRTVFDWSHTQPTAGGPLDFSDSDQKVALASRHGITLLPVVLYTPFWAARDPEAFGAVPANPADYAAFMRELVLRYGPDGSFWRERPNLPKRPIRDWHIWNEMHFDIYWDVGQAGRTRWATEYVALLRAAAPAIKGADPGARVVLGGLAEISWDNLALLYREGAQGLFDVATLHIFTGDVRFVMRGASFMRRVMRRNGDARKPLWITETTFPAGKGKARRPRLAWQRQWYSTERGAAKRLQALYRLGAKRRRRLRLERIYWVTWASSYRGNVLFNYTGLVRYRGKRVQTRPLLAGFRASARRLQGCAKTRRGACVR